eukprot:gene20868-32183_t
MGGRVGLRLAVLVAAAQLCAGQAFTWSECTGSFSLNFTSVSVSPVPIVANRPNNLSVGWESYLTGNSDVQSGSLAIRLAYGSVPVGAFSWNLSSPTSPFKCPCPLEPGQPWNASDANVTFPSLPYNGVIGGTAVMTDQ